MLACFYDPWSKQNKQVCIWFFLPAGDTRARYLHGAKLWNGNLLWRKTSEQGQGLWHIRNTPQAKHMNFHWVILDLDARTVRVCMYKYIHNIIICIFVFRRYKVSLSSFLPKNGYKTTHAKATHEFASKAIPTRLHTLKFPCPVVKHIAMIRATPMQHDRRRPPATCADSRSRSHLMTRWDRPRPACKVRVTSLHRHFSKDSSQVPTCSKHPTIHQGLDAKTIKLSALQLPSPVTRLRTCVQRPLITERGASFRVWFHACKAPDFTKAWRERPEQNYQDSSWSFLVDFMKTHEVKLKHHFNILYWQIVGCWDREFTSFFPWFQS